MQMCLFGGLEKDGCSYVFHPSYPPLASLKIRSSNIFGLPNLLPPYRLERLIHLDRIKYSLLLSLLGLHVHLDDQFDIYNINYITKKLCR
jgi:hypothetical protein